MNGDSPPKDVTLAAMATSARAEVIFEIIEAINRDGTTVLLVEQNAAQALKLADRGYVLETGSIVMSGVADTMLQDDRIRAAYLGEEIAV